MFFRPSAERVQRFNQGPPESRERVFDFWRNDWMNSALHEAVAFETAQGLRQHFLRNPADLALERGVTHRAASEDLNNERGPFIGNAIEHKPGGTLRIHHRGAGGRFSHIFLLLNLPLGARRE